MSFGPSLAFLLTVFGQMDDEFRWDSGDAELAPALSRFGPNAMQTIASESGRLRITLPADRENRASVGIEPRFSISGDFDIVLSYEIVSVDVPSTGMGAGIKVWGRINSSEFQAMTLAHVTSPGGTSRFSAIYAKEDRRGKRRFKVKDLATEAKRGRLRLARTGSELAFAVAEGNAEEFHELQQVRVGTGDVLVLRISGTTSGDACGVSLRLTDLRIRADTLPDKRTALAKGPGGWVIVWVLIVAGIGASGFFLWRYRSAVWGLWPWRS